MITSVTLTPQTKWEDLTPKQMEIIQTGNETMMMTLMAAGALWEKDNVEGFDLDPEKGKVHVLHTEDDITIEQWLKMKNLEPTGPEDIEELKIQGKVKSSGEYSITSLKNDVDYDINGDGVMDKVMEVSTYVEFGNVPEKSMKIYMNNEMQTVTIIEEDFRR